MIAYAVGGHSGELQINNSTGIESTIDDEGAKGEGNHLPPEQPDSSRNSQLAKDPLTQRDHLAGGLPLDQKLANQKHEDEQNCILAFAPCNATRAALQGIGSIQISEEAPTFRSEKEQTFCSEKEQTFCSDEAKTSHSEKPQTFHPGKLHTFSSKVRGAIADGISV